MSFMFNPQTAVPEVSTRSLMFRHALAAAFKARRQNLPVAPVALPALLDYMKHGMSGVLARPGARETLNEIRAVVFSAAGRDVETQSSWHESLAAAVFASRIAQFRSGSVAAAACGGLLHRAGEALALKMLARVELEYRWKLDGAAQREWCASQGYELAERLVRGWTLPADVGSCVLGWKRFAEFADVSAESAAVYLGRLLAIEMLHPELCVPGAIEIEADGLGFDADALEQLRADEGCARELMRSLQ
jgi:hypothetical protein